VDGMDNSKKIDFLACERHNFSHLRPIWDTLPSGHRGVFHILTQLDREEKFIGLDEIDNLRVFESPNELTVSLNNGIGLLVTSTFYDHFLPEISRPLVFVAHGGGQTYIGQYEYQMSRKNYILDMVPNESMANVFDKRYPFSKKVVIGSPKMDKWHLTFNKPNNLKPVIAISFHFDRKAIPESSTAWPYFQNILPQLAKQNDWTILGHGHPRMIDTLAPHYEQLGIEIVRDFDDVLKRADLYICDHMATLYEFASTDRPVVVLNAPWYRRDVEHGLRFWEHADVGINCDHPDDLFKTIELALTDPEDQQKKRKKAVRGVYAYTDGKASQRSAQVIVSLAKSVFDKPFFLYPGTTEESINAFLINNDIAFDYLEKRIEYHQLELLKYLHRFKEGEQVHMKDMEFHVWALVLLLIKSKKNSQASKIYNDCHIIFSDSEHLAPLFSILRSKLKSNNTKNTSESYLRMAKYYFDKGMTDKAEKYVSLAKKK
jgi:hypothetical protein